MAMSKLSFIMQFFSSQNVMYQPRSLEHPWERGAGRCNQVLRIRSSRDVLQERMDAAGLTGLSFFSDEETYLFV